MIRTGYVDARNHGDSPGTRRNVPIASSLFVSCSGMPTLAAKKSACTINLRHSLEAPLRVDCGVLATPSQALARDLPPAVPRIDGASCSCFSSYCPAIRDYGSRGALLRRRERRRSFLRERRRSRRPPSAIRAERAQRAEQSSGIAGEELF
jgi:hypothetical protein